MEMINAILLMTALIFVWAAINMEKPAVQRLEQNQTEQFNDSIEFLKMLRNPSASEQSQSRRINAYKRTMDTVKEEIPDSVNAIVDQYNQTAESQNETAERILNLTYMIQSNTKDNREDVAQNTDGSIGALNVLVDKIGKLENLIPSIEQSNQIAADSLRSLENDTKEVKQCVGY